MRLAFFVIASVAFFSTNCGKKSQTSNLSENSTNANKPTDKSEGLPGYIAKMDQVTYRFDGSQLEVSGPEGTVVAFQASPSDLLVNVWNVPEQTLSEIENSTEPQAIINGLFVGSIRPENDGSINGVFETELEHDFLVLQVARESENANVRFHSEPFKKPTLGFTEVSEGSTDHSFTPIATLAGESEGDGGDQGGNESDSKTCGNGELDQSERCDANDGLPLGKGQVCENQCSSIGFTIPIRTRARYFKNEHFRFIGFKRNQVLIRCAKGLKFFFATDSSNSCSGELKCQSGKQGSRVCLARCEDGKRDDSIRFICKP